MLNKVVLIGRIGKINTSIPTATKYSLASTESFKNPQTNDWDEKTEWHNLVSFSNCSQYVRNNLKPGDLVYVEGKLQTSKWQDDNGIDRSTTEVVVFDFPKKLPSFWTKSSSNDVPNQPAMEHQASVVNGAPQAQPAPVPPTDNSWAGDIPDFH